MFTFRGPNSVTLFDILPQTHFLTGWTGLEAGTQKREVIESSEAWSPIGSVSSMGKSKRLS